MQPISFSRRVLDIAVECSIPKCKLKLLSALAKRLLEEHERMGLSNEDRNVLLEIPIHILSFCIPHSEPDKLLARIEDIRYSVLDREEVQEKRKLAELQQQKEFEQSKQQCKEYLNQDKFKEAVFFAIRSSATESNSLEIVELMEEHGKKLIASKSFEKAFRLIQSLPKQYYQRNFNLLLSASKRKTSLDYFMAAKVSLQLEFPKLVLEEPINEEKMMEAMATCNSENAIKEKRLLSPYITERLKEKVSELSKKEAGECIAKAKHSIQAKDFFEARKAIRRAPQDTPGYKELAEILDKPFIEKAQHYTNNYPIEAVKECVSMVYKEHQNSIINKIKIDDASNIVERFFDTKRGFVNDEQKLHYILLVLRNFHTKFEKGDFYLSQLAYSYFSLGQKKLAQTVITWIKDGLLKNGVTNFLQNKPVESQQETKMAHSDVNRNWEKFNLSCVLNSTTSQEGFYPFVYIYDQELQFQAYKYLVQLADHGLDLLRQYCLSKRHKQPKYYQQCVEFLNAAIREKAEQAIKLEKYSEVLRLIPFISNDEKFIDSIVKRIPSETQQKELASCQKDGNFIYDAICLEKAYFLVKSMNIEEHEKKLLQKIIELEYGSLKVTNEVIIIPEKIRKMISEIPKLLSSESERKHDKEMIVPSFSSFIKGSECYQFSTLFSLQVNNWKLNHGYLKLLDKLLQSLDEGEEIFSIGEECVQMYKDELQRIFEFCKANESKIPKLLMHWLIVKTRIDIVEQLKKKPPVKNEFSFEDFVPSVSE